MKNKRGQVSIFIIVGIVLIAAIGLFFALRQGNVVPTPGKTTQENPTSFIESCIYEKTHEAIDYLSLRGGYADNKLSKQFTFGNEEPRNITYLCYNQNSYLPCINQKPLFIEDLKEELKKQVSDKIETCFEDMISNFKNKGYETDVRYNDFSIMIMPNEIVIQTDSEIILIKGGETTREENPKIEIPSRIYGIANIANEIVNQEARFCYAEISGIGITYPEYVIEKTKTDDLTNIYTIESRKSGEKFRFAVRSCAIPPTL
ncbi:hypothetical protein COU59_01100 [Candidatus Pacearchaeota archaeon CG10_big_fil_rev_8_21_14_0_10_34_12]|nr:MAG: hypothetical protein COU59_01100 [Candidatus Pacearchaeota archaeon CG10_big_fil_rev_8_21_14_0_10_34_12]